MKAKPAWNVEMLGESRFQVDLVIDDQGRCPYSISMHRDGMVPMVPEPNPPGYVSSDNQVWIGSLDEWMALLRTIERIGKARFKWKGDSDGWRHGW